MGKGQGTVETTILLAAGLIAIIATGIIISDSVGSFSKISDSELNRAALAQLDTAGASIAGQSVGARIELKIELPSNPRNITFRNKTIELYFNDGKKFTRSTGYTIFGKMNATVGNNYVAIQALEKGVCFGDVTTC